MVCGAYEGNVRCSVEKISLVCKVFHVRNADDRCGRCTSSCQLRSQRSLEADHSLHCAKSKNQCCGNFRPYIHLQTPDHEYRDDTQCPIHHAGNRRVPVSGVDCDSWVDTRSFSACISRPEIGRRPTLQDKEEEVKGTIEFNYYDSCPDDNSVCPYNRDSKKENANAEFQSHVGEDVDGLTRPPPLHSILVSARLWISDLVP